jgi:hypothetical protein
MRRVLFVWLLSCLVISSASAYTVPTHELIMRAIVERMFDDGAYAWNTGNLDRGKELYQAAEFWSAHQDQLVAAIGEADFKPYLFEPIPWSVHHGWNPNTDRGWLGFVGAPEYANLYEQTAILAYFNGDEAKMAHYTGAVLHLLTDMTVPHHVACNLDDGHADFEYACQRIVNPIDHHARGIYSLPDWSESELVDLPVSVWIYYEATISGPLYEAVGPSTDLARANDEVVGRYSINQAVSFGAGYLTSLYRFLVGRG